MTSTRTETDTFGPIEVASDRYWGAQAQRSLGNFKIGWEKQPLSVIHFDSPVGALTDFSPTVLHYTEIA